MNRTDPYFYSLSIGIGIQVFLVGSLLLEPLPFLFFTILNCFLMVLFYPLLILWLSDQNWTPINSALGPHQ